MKTKIRIISLLLITIIFLSSKEVEIPNVLNTNKRFVKIEDNLFVDKYEVCIKDYKFFLANKKLEEKDISNLIYDSTKWTSGTLSYSHMEHYYFNLKSFENHPIVAISYDAVLEFCNWLSEKYNSDSERKFKKVIFRLPTEKEFIKVAISDFEKNKIFYPWGYNSLIDSKNQNLCNFARLSQKDIDFDGKSFTYKSIIDFENDIETVNSYRPNKLGVFNIVGNASEMIQDKGYAMGGDFLSTGYNVRVTSKKKFKDKDITVGFRVYMEIIEF